MAAQTRIKRNKVAVFLKGSEDPKYTRIGKSELLDIAYNGTTTERWYIDQENPQETLENYKLTLAQEVATVKGSEDYDMIFDIAYNRNVGEGAKRECIIAFLAETSDSSNFKAWRTQASVVINDIDMIAEKILFNVNLGGEIENGTVTMLEGQPTFSPAE